MFENTAPPSPPRPPRCCSHVRHFLVASPVVGLGAAAAACEVGFGRAGAWSSRCRRRCDLNRGADDGRRKRQHLPAAQPGSVAQTMSGGAKPSICDGSKGGEDFQPERRTCVECAIGCTVDPRRERVVTPSNEWTTKL
jgi:hypothetical protein